MTVWPRVRASRSRLAAMVGLAIIGTLILGSDRSLVPKSEALAATTMLTSVRGDVAVGHADGVLTQAREGELLGVGDTIRVRIGTAEITYGDGSTVRGDGPVELMIERLETPANGGNVSVMTQAIGRTWRVITMLISGGSRYEVKMPTSSATVRG